MHNFNRAILYNLKQIGQSYFDDKSKSQFRSQDDLSRREKNHGTSVERKIELVASRSEDLKPE